MFECRTFITVKEIGEVLGVSESKSYGIVRDLNKELADKGYMVIPGRVSRKYFEERFYGGENETEVKEVQQAVIRRCHIICLFYHRMVKSCQKQTHQNTKSQKYQNSGCDHFFFFENRKHNLRSFLSLP